MIRIDCQIDNKITVLSSKTRIFKTDQFVKQTNGITNMDLFVSKMAGAIVENIVVKENYFSNVNEKDKNEEYIVTTIDREHSLFFKFGYQIDNNFNISKCDIIFFKYIGKSKVGKHLDRRFIQYLKQKSTIDVVIKSTYSNTSNTDFLKLYVLFNSDQVNFPLLNEEQQKIVLLEDQNVLVQGVAGSGKTNVCIDKIIYAACRRYKGKVLYSTYSHGLLVDTQTKVNLFNYNIQELLKKIANNEIRFADKDYKKSVENYLGIWLDVDELSHIIEKLKAVSSYLENNVDYYLIEDMYRLFGDKYDAYANEQYFVNSYLNNMKNYNLSGNLDRIKNISNEVVYKEIYGIIFGCGLESDLNHIYSLNEYLELRKECFSKLECETVYSIAMDYLKHLEKNNIVDNNLSSRRLLNKLDVLPQYSLCVLDEVQDFTQINLCLFKKLSMKMFCVGDVLQMINPTYFSFAYLKRLMFEKDIVSVIELKNNYRNSQKIEHLIDNLSDLNISQFGTHSFVIRGKSIESDLPTRAAYIQDEALIRQLQDNVFEDLTVVVGNLNRKKELRKTLPKQEILTVSEIKGLERNSIILLDILSDNFDKWSSLQRNIINKKKAEENSIYRYYFNLLYVGISRAKQNLFVVERKNVELFKKYFSDNFENLTVKNGFELLCKVVKKQEIDEDEIQNRIEQFIRQEQFDNAKWTAEKLPDEDDRNLQLGRINVFEKYVSKSLNKNAGVEFWKLGLFDDAKTQFTISKDYGLIKLIDACVENDGQKLEYDIVNFYPDVLDSDVAKKLIIDTLKNDLKDIKNNQNSINSLIKKNWR